MTAIAAALRAGSVRRPSAGSVLVAILGLVVLAATARAASHPEGLRLALAVAAVVLLAGVGLVVPRASLYLLVAWLPALGLVRRLLDAVAPAPRADPLLLVAPLGIAVLLVLAFAAGAFRGRTPLSNGVAALTVLTLVAALNPLQGSFAEGLASLLLILVPLLLFWIGRTLVSRGSLTVVLKTVAAVGLLAATYGLYQTFSGFPSWDARWVSESGYAALNVGGVIRPFSSFSSSAEYAYFAAAAFVVWFALGVRRGWLPLGVGACGLLAVAVFYESSRGVVLLMTAAVALMLAARIGLRPLPALAVGGVFLLLLPVVVGKLAPRTSAGGSGALALHQAEGLARPFDPQSSTLLSHLELIRHGLAAPLHDPLGTGLAGVTGIGGRLGDVQQADRNTEADPSNVAVAMGAPGLLAYLLVFFAGLSRAYRVARRSRDPLALAVLGILVATLFQWLNGAQYSVALLPWLLLGWLDRPRESGT